MNSMSLRSIFCDNDDQPLDKNSISQMLKDANIGSSSEVTLERFRAVLKHRGISVSEQQSNELFRQIDINENGVVDTDEMHHAIVHDFRKNFFEGEKRSKAQVMGIEEGVEIDTQSVVKTKGVTEMFEDLGAAKKDARDTLLLQHASGMSVEMVKHLFLDLDEDNSGTISKSELYLLGPMLGQNWTDDQIDEIVAVADKDNNGELDFDEFYTWSLENIKVDENAELKKRDRAIELAKYNDIPPKFLNLLNELCGHVLQEAPERPGETEQDQFGQGRFLKDHLMSCYLQAKIWGGSQDFCNACLFHAIYEPGFQFRVVDLTTARPFLRCILGEHGEWLLYNFIGASRSIFNPDGLYHAPLEPGSWKQRDFQTGDMQVMPFEKRRDLVRMEFSNNYDKMYIHDEKDAATSLWLYCQHITVYDLLLDGQKEVVDRYGARGKEATCEQVAKWHERRFKGSKITETWAKHIDMFRVNGKYYEMEKNGTLFMEKKK